MSFPRRQLLRMLSYVAPSFLLAQNQLGVAAPTGRPMRFGFAEAAQAEKVSGIGGFFFRAQDPETLGRWYQEHLGITVIPTGKDQSAWQQEAGPTAFTPMPQKTGYFGDPQKDWMVNFRVHNLDKLATQLSAAGITVKVDPKTYPYGRFAHLHDPEGNPIELWQPGA